jgi:hypothetical protein
MLESLFFDSLFIASQSEEEKAAAHPELDQKVWNA